MEQRVLKSTFEERTISHYGVLEKSGRYPWGSGERPFQRLQDWQGYVKKLQREGVSMEDIAKSSGMTLDELKDSLISTNQKKNQEAVRNAQQRVADVTQAWRLKEKGYSNIAIAERMGISEGTVRNLLKPGADAKARIITNVSDALRDAVDSKGYIDIGGGVELHLGINKSRMDACIELLKEEGYQVFWTKTKQLGTGQYTTVRVLAPPDADYKDFKAKYDEDNSIVKPIGFCGDDHGNNIREIQPPVLIDRKRIFVRYGDEGGSERDGLIQLRPGIEDIDLMDTRYAQVRVGVEGGLYMKGMAVYSKDIPDGYDIVYNVNKSSGSPDTKVFKKMKEGDDPFGATTSLKGVDEETGEIIYQKDYIGSDGKMHQSALNIVNDQGVWNTWSRNLPSQMLGKQPVELAERQLKITAQSKQDEFDSIMALTNPTIKKKLLEEFAEGCDSDAVHLKAAALPRQRTQVLLPIPELADNEIYAPNFRDGETVALIRFPHASISEIPVLTVNNKNKQGIDMIGKAGNIDAVGINSKVAERLSGADFDGDTALVIPNNSGEIKSAPRMEALKNFNMDAYTLPEGHPDLKKSEAKRTEIKNRQMGIVSNLITDMTIQGASQDELARAIRHSMIVIDSVKHDYDWKQSEKDHGIQELRDKYQPKEDPTKPGGGAYTLLSRAKSEERVIKRTEAYSTRDLNEEELAAWNRGEKVYKVAKDAYYEEFKKTTNPDGTTTYTPTGKTKVRLQKSTKMKEAKDARELSSGTAIEEVYADYANAMKSLANQARAAARATPRLEKSPSAAKTYAAEVESLKEKVLLSEKNRPIERQAQLVANAAMAAKVRSNPELAENKDSYSKQANKALTQARSSLGANKKAVQVDITDREWEAIQAGAVSDSFLTRILTNTDMDSIRQRATPREGPTVSAAQRARIEVMYRNGLTQAEIADAIGVSTSTVATVLK